jgi:hypothetical protein
VDLAVGFLYIVSGLFIWGALPIGVPLALAVCTAGTPAFQVLCQLIVPVVNWVMDRRRPRAEKDPRP